MPSGSPTRRTVALCGCSLAGRSSGTSARARACSHACSAVPTAARCSSVRHRTSTGSPAARPERGGCCRCASRSRTAAGRSSRAGPGRLLLAVGLCTARHRRTVDGRDATGGRRRDRASAVGMPCPVASPQSVVTEVRHGRSTSSRRSRRCRCRSRCPRKPAGAVAERVPAQEARAGSVDHRRPDNRGRSAQTRGDVRGHVWSRRHGAQGSDRSPRRGSAGT
jgi:hypothetical protein